MGQEEQGKEAAGLWGSSSSGFRGRGLRGLVERVLGRRRPATAEELEERIADLVDEGEARGLISPDEGQMIERVLALAERTAGQVMVPRVELVAVEEGAGLEEVVKLIMDSGHSRIPVFRGDMDHVVGVVHAKDLLAYWGGRQLPRLKDIMRSPIYVREGMRLDRLLKLFKARRVHLAVVLDEFGGTAGIVTMEDVLEEIVGEIEDEYDQHVSLARPQPDGSVVVEARMELDKLEELLGCRLPRQWRGGRFETVGGLVSTVLGKVPARGEEAEVEGVRFKVERASPRRVEVVRVWAGRGR